MLTRLGPSRVVPGALGVFATRQLKKFTPIEIEPNPAGSSPPLVLDLAKAPTKTISLRRFLALRHQFCAQDVLNVETPRSYYLILPSTHSPIPDASALKEWKERHHHRYTPEPVDLGGSGPGERQTASFSIPAHRDFVEGLDDDVADALLAREQRATGELEVGEVHSPSERSCATPSTRRKKRRPEQPVFMPEEHLFHINDGVPWEKPPPDDLSSPAYWKLHQKRMLVYKEQLDPERARAVLFGTLAASSADAAVIAKATETLLQNEELYRSRNALLEALTRKANARVDVDEATGLLTVQPLVDLNEGDEFLFHYGWQWWSRSLLSQLFLAVSDDEMRSIRWIEGLLRDPADPSPQPFPDLTVVPRRPPLARRPRPRGRKGKASRAADADDAAGTVESTERAAVHHSAWCLYDRTTRARATDEASLMFAVRRSCVDGAFLSALVMAEVPSSASALSGRGASAPFFDQQQQDVEVPMRFLRRALLVSLEPKLQSVLPPLVSRGRFHDDADGGAEDGDDDTVVF